MYPEFAKLLHCASMLALPASSSLLQSSSQAHCKVVGLLHPLLIAQGDGLQTERGWGQARAAGQRIKEVMEADGKPYRLYFYTSPYKRSHQTYQALAESFATSQVAGQQEEVQLREQDFGNFQVAAVVCWSPDGVIPRSQ